MLPDVVEQGIARFADVFCEPGVFTIESKIRFQSITGWPDSASWACGCDVRA